MLQKREKKSRENVKKNVKYDVKYSSVRCHLYDLKYFCFTILDILRSFCGLK